MLCMPLVLNVTIFIIGCLYVLVLGASLKLVFGVVCVVYGGCGV